MSSERRNTMQVHGTPGKPDNNLVLSSDELPLCELLRKLNDAGKEALLCTARGLATQKCFVPRMKLGEKQQTDESSFKEL